MGTGRRKFLQVAGLAALGVSLKPALSALAGEEFVVVAPHAPKIEANGKKRWAMVVDPAKCAKDPGCTDCITACHTIHNVPDFDDPRHETKWIWKAKYENAFDHHDEGYATGGLFGQSILLMCNHCDNPPCVRVCPTQAAWKREEDGIIMFDMHRCIGCRFCMAGCPYGARSFNYRDPRPFIKEINPKFPTRAKGLVEKCNFCEERLPKGLLPACVEACPERALVFGDLQDPNSEVRRLLASHYTVRRKAYLGTRPQVYYIAT